MTGFIQGKTTIENLPIKRFGYVLSTIVLGITVALMLMESPLSALSFILLMYLLTGALWAPALIKPFYNWFGHYLFPAKQETQESAQKDTDEKHTHDR